MNLSFSLYPPLVSFESAWFIFCFNKWRSFMHAKKGERTNDDDDEWMLSGAICQRIYFECVWWGFGKIVPCRHIKSRNWASERSAKKRVKITSRPIYFFVFRGFSRVYMLPILAIKSHKLFSSVLHDAWIIRLALISQAIKSLHHTNRSFLTEIFTHIVSTCLTKVYLRFYFALLHTQYMLTSFTYFSRMCFASATTYS